MPSKSRRLPGGKVRRPPTRAKAVTAPEGADVVAPPEPAATPPEAVAAPPRPQQAADTAALRRTAPQTVQLPIDAMPSAAAAPLGAGAAAAAAAPRRRGAVTARALTGRQVARTGPTSLDLAEASLTYVRPDLLRIMILALVMVGIIAVLAVVLH